MSETETPTETETATVVESTGAQVLDQTREFFSRFCSMPSQAALDTVVLWTAHTHVTDSDGRLAFDTTPRLALLSDEPASGKTTVLEMIGRIGRNGNACIDVTPATLAVMTHEKRATMLLDEIDILFGAGNSKASVRSILNAGYKRGQTWPRANKEECIIFAPVALGGLGRTFKSSSAMSALRSRSIIVDMVARKHPGESYNNRLHSGTAAMIKSDLVTWVQRNTGRITESWPDMPKGVFGRTAEIWDPLFMIAEIAGGHWPQTVRDACRELALGESDAPAETPVSAQLLADLRVIFGETEALPTTTIVDRLYALEGAPWLALWPHAGTAPRELAAMLAPLGGEPVKVREGNRSVRGYRASMLAPLWSNVPASDRHPIQTEQD